MEVVEEVEEVESEREVADLVGEKRLDVLEVLCELVSSSSSFFLLLLLLLLLLFLACNQKAGCNVAATLGICSTKSMIMLDSGNSCARHLMNSHDPPVEEEVEEVEELGKVEEVGEVGWGSFLRGLTIGTVCNPCT